MSTSPACSQEKNSDEQAAVAEGQEPAGKKMCTREEHNPSEMVIGDVDEMTYAELQQCAMKLHFPGNMQKGRMLSLLRAYKAGDEQSMQQALAEHKATRKSHYRRANGTATSKHLPERQRRKATSYRSRRYTPRRRSKGKRSTPVDQDDSSISSHDDLMEEEEDRDAEEDRVSASPEPRDSDFPAVSATTSAPPRSDPQPSISDLSEGPPQPSLLLSQLLKSSSRPARSHQQPQSAPRPPRDSGPPGPPQQWTRSAAQSSDLPSSSTQPRGDDELESLLRVLLCSPEPPDNPNLSGASNHPIQSYPVYSNSGGFSSTGYPNTGGPYNHSGSQTFNRPGMINPGGPIFSHSTMPNSGGPIFTHPTMTNTGGPIFSHPRMTNMRGPTYHPPAMANREGFPFNLPMTPSSGGYTECSSLQQQQQHPWNYNPSLPPGSEQGWGPGPNTWQRPYWPDQAPPPQQQPYTAPPQQNPAPRSNFSGEPYGPATPTYMAPHGTTQASSYDVGTVNSAANSSLQDATFSAINGYFQSVHSSPAYQSEPRYSVAASPVTSVSSMVWPSRDLVTPIPSPAMTTLMPHSASITPARSEPLPLAGLMTPARSMSPSPMNSLIPEIGPINSVRSDFLMPMTPAPRLDFLMPMTPVRPESRMSSCYMPPPYDPQPNSGWVIPVGYKSTPRESTPMAPLGGGKRPCTDVVPVGARKRVGRQREEEKSCSTAVQNKLPGGQKCRFAYLGCQNRLRTASQMVNHERKCPFLKAICVVEMGCAWTGPVCHFRNHILKDHESEIKEGVIVSHYVMLSELRSHSVVRLVQFGLDTMLLIEVHFKGQTLHAACQWLPHGYRVKEEKVNVTLEMIGVDDKLYTWRGRIEKYPTTFPLPCGAPSPGTHYKGQHIRFLSVPLPWIYHTRFPFVILHVTMKQHTALAIDTTPNLGRPRANPDCPALEGPSMVAASCSTTEPRRKKLPPLPSSRCGSNKRNPHWPVLDTPSTASSALKKKPSELPTSSSVCKKKPSKLPVLEGPYTEVTQCSTKEAPKALSSSLTTPSKEASKMPALEKSSTEKTPKKSKRSSSSRNAPTKQASKKKRKKGGTTPKCLPQSPIVIPSDDSSSSTGQKPEEEIGTGRGNPREMTAAEREISPSREDTPPLIISSPVYSPEPQGDSN